MCIHSCLGGRVVAIVRRMTNALVLLGHADDDSFNAALARAYAKGFRSAGGTVNLVRVADLAFDPVVRRGPDGSQPLESDLVEMRDAFDAAQHVAWFFPTYWASPPAVVRGLVDRLFVPGWAYRYAGGLPQGLLKGRSARVVTTMDSPAWWYAFSQNRAIHGAFVSGTLRFVGFGPIRTRAVHSLRDFSAAARASLLNEMPSLARIDHAKAPRPRAARLPGQVDAPRTVA